MALGWQRGCCLTLGLLAWSHLLLTTSASALVEAEGNSFQPTVDLQAACPDMRIAVVNGVSFHFEVLAGLLHVLKPYAQHVDVFMSPWVRKENYDGARLQCLLQWHALQRTCSINRQ